MAAWIDWPQIGCQNPEPHEHRTFEVEVDLSERHGYLDYAPVPEWLTPPPFKMEVWDWTVAAVSNKPVEGMWCPARDAVSETIAEHGIWEPPETIALSMMFEWARLSGMTFTFVDIGAQLGWFSMLAQHYGLHPFAIEGDKEVAAILRRNLHRTDRPDVKHPDTAVVQTRRITPNSKLLNLVTPTIAKIDIEGAEVEALNMLEPIIDQDLLWACLVELTPGFKVDYTRIIKRLMDAGLVAAFLPRKDDPYIPFATPADFDVVDDWVTVNARVAVEYQINLLFVEPSILAS